MENVFILKKYYGFKIAPTNIKIQGIKPMIKGRGRISAGSCYCRLHKNYMIMKSRSLKMLLPIISQSSVAHSHGFLFLSIEWIYILDCNEHTK